MVGLLQEDLWQPDVAKRQEERIRSFVSFRMTVTINMRGHASH